MHSPVPLEPALAAFITSRLSIQVAASDGHGLASLVRAVGCRVSADRCRVTVLVSRSQAAPVLAGVAANGMLAAVFNEPESHRTVQLKGRDACVEMATAEDEAALVPYAADFSGRLAVFRVPEAYVRTLVSCAPGDLVAISFTPSEAYGQTPGPRAGMRLEGGQP